jgi:WD40 repeat protein
MFLRRITLLLAPVVLTLAGLSGLADSPSPANSYPAVDAIFARRCLDCHAGTDPEAKLVLDDYDSVLKGGENGPAVKAGKSAESLLIQMVEGSVERDGKKKIMPPGKREKLSPEEIKTLKAWVDAGAPAPPKGFVAIHELNVPKIDPRVPTRRPINAVAATPDGKLAALARYGEVELFAVEEQETTATLPGLRGDVNALVFSPSGKELFAASGENVRFGEVKEFSVPGGQLVKTFTGHKDAIYAVAVSPDGKTLATGSYDQKIKLWDIATGAELKTLSGHNGAVFGLSFRADGKVLASASSDRTVKLWDTATGDRLDTLSQSLKELYAVAFSPDGKRVAAGGADNRIRVWDVSPSARETPPPIISRFAHEGAILRLVFSSDGKKIVSAAQDLTVKIWDAPNVEEKLLVEKQPDWPTGLAFGPENKSALVGRLDGSWSIYDTASGGLVKPPRPSLTSVSPRGIQRGVVTKLRLGGQRLAGLTGAKSAGDKLAVRLAQSASSKDEAWLEVEPAKDTPRGSQKIAVTGSHGDSDWATIWVDDIPQANCDGASGNFITLASLPAAVWGTIAKPGDAASAEFDVKAGQILIFDSETADVGSKAKVNLKLEDPSGQLLAHNEGFAARSNPLMVYASKEDRHCRLVVSEAMLDASADHYFKVTVGALPLVTGFFPLSVATGSVTQIQLAGYNLPSNAAVQLNAASETGEINLPLDRETYRTRSLPKLQITRERELVESEPNDTPAQANSIVVPSVVSGRIWSRDGRPDADLFKFSAKQGQRIVLETEAARRGSLADTKVEVLYPDGRPVRRVLLQAVRDSHITFNGINSDGSNARLENWTEMELNEYLYMQGEVCKLFRAPQGPDSGFEFYTSAGKRRDFFDTSPIAHANDEACYIVEPLPPEAKPLANGLPVFMVDYENDDDAERKLGTDSKVIFVPPADGEYLARVTDSRSYQGPEFSYRLFAREARPDFSVTLDGANPTIPEGSGQPFSARTDRNDGFEGEIKIEIEGLPPGFVVSSPLVIQAGHSQAQGVIYALPGAQWPDDKHPLRTKITATAMVDGKPVTKPVNDFGSVKRGEKPKARVALGPDDSRMIATPPTNSNLIEITIAPGETIPARLKVWRDGYDDLFTFSVDNLPHGIIVDNIGLNGVLIPKGQDERRIFLSAARWVPDTDRLCYAIENQVGRQTSIPVLLHVRKGARMASVGAAATAGATAKP